jgi:hypothetical protein
MTRRGERQECPPSGELRAGGSLEEGKTCRSSHDRGWWRWSYAPLPVVELPWLPWWLVTLTRWTSMVAQWSSHGGQQRSHVMPSSMDLASLTDPTMHVGSRRERE